MQLSALFSSRRLAAGELMTELISAWERLNPTVNAIVAFDAEGGTAGAAASQSRAMKGEMRGPLDGIPITVKDNLFVRRLPATWGSRLYMNWKPEHDDIGIARLREAGAILLGKTNTPEFALASNTNNLLFGATRNPWNTKLTPGGSSGGSVAAVACGLGPLSVGTDAGGSIRRPAAYTGVVGMRPSTGRIPRLHGFPSLSPDYQVLAPTARTVDDTYLLFRTMAGQDQRDRRSMCFNDYPLPPDLSKCNLKPLRIGLLLGIDDAPVERVIVERVERAGETFVQLGHRVEEIPPPFSLMDVEYAWTTVTYSGLVHLLGQHEDAIEGVTEGTLALYKRACSILARDYAGALEKQEAVRARMTRCFEAVDILLTPTSACLPWTMTEAYPTSIDGRPATPRAAGIFSGFVNVAGLPALSVPAEPLPDGTPVGIQLVGAFGGDLQLLSLARQFEIAAPWAHRWPTLGGHLSPSPSREP
jgi:aspartyl-tRNA(Asn)/glutamyl-tRNA(Gln) amidotransferase subunit A